MILLLPLKLKIVLKINGLITQEQYFNIIAITLPPSEFIERFLCPSPGCQCCGNFYAAAATISADQTHVIKLSFNSFRYKDVTHVKEVGSITCW